MDSANGTTEIATSGAVCPLSTEQLVDLVMSFIDIINRPADIYLYTYQRVFLRAILYGLLEHTGDTITGLWSRQSGKSESLASLAVGACVFIPALARAFPGDDRLSQYKGGLWIGIFAPKQQQSGIIYERIRHRAERQSSQELYADPEIATNIAASRGDKVSWTNGSFVVAKTASDQSNVEGDTYHLVFIDEAQLVSRSKVAKEISPMLAATNGLMVKIGTANASRGGFHDSITYNVERQKTGGIRSHFQFPYDVVIEQKRQVYDQTKDPRHLNYEKWVKTELERLGGNTDSVEFKMNFRLLWQETMMGAIDMTVFELAGEDTLEMNDIKQWGGRQVAGLDLGKVIDDTVLTIIEIDGQGIVDTAALVRPGEENPLFHLKRILAWGEMHGSWEEQLKQITNMLMQFSVDTLVVDSNGVGDPIAERLIRLLPSINVVPFPCSYVGNDKIYKYYIQELEAGRFLYPKGERTMRTTEYQKFVHQHRSLVKQYSGRYLACKAPDGEHEDYCDSAALACWAEQYTAPMLVECESFPMYSNGSAEGRSSRADRYRQRR